MATTLHIRAERSLDIEVRNLPDVGDLSTDEQIIAATEQYLQSIGEDVPDFTNCRVDPPIDERQDSEAEWTLRPNAVDG